MRLSPSASASCAGEHREHARHGARLRRIDRADARVRVRRAHHGRVGLAGKIEIVAVAAASSDEPQIFLAANRVSDTCVHDAYAFNVWAVRDRTNGG